MFDESNMVYPGHLLGKLQKIDPYVFDKLAAAAAALFENQKKDLLFPIEKEDALIKNPMLLAKNAVRSAFNTIVEIESKEYLIPVGFSIGAGGHPDVGAKKWMMSANFATAMLQHIENDKTNIMEKAAITEQELSDLRFYSEGSVQKEISVQKAQPAPKKPPGSKGPRRA